MADKLLFGEGASINRPPLFCGTNFGRYECKSLLKLLTKAFGIQLKMDLLFP